jgi:hypothetical protein
MQISAFIRSAFIAPATDNAHVDNSGGIDFDRASDAKFAWTKSRAVGKFLPFIRAAGYDIAGLGQYGRQNAIRAAVWAATDLQSWAFITGASVTVDNSCLEVWVRPGWHARSNAEIRRAIETSIAESVTPEPPKGAVRKLFHNDDRKRAQMASDRRMSFIGDWVDRNILGE